MTAASARRATTRVSASGPSRSSSSPRTERGGRELVMVPDWARQLAARRPRSSTRARTRQATPLSSQRRVAADTRPDTSSSARRFVTISASSASRSPMSGAVTWKPRAAGPPSTSRSSGVSMSTPSRQRERRSATATPALSSSHRGRALSAGSGGSPSRSAARETATTSAE